MEHDEKCKFDEMVDAFVREVRVDIDRVVRKRIGDSRLCCGCIQRVADKDFEDTLDTDLLWASNFWRLWQKESGSGGKVHGGGFMAGGIRARGENKRLADQQLGKVIGVDFRNRRKL